MLANSHIFPYNITTAQGGIMGRKGSNYAFLVFLGLLVIGFGYMMRDFATPAALALVAATLLAPVQARMEKLCRGRRYLAAILTVIISLVVVIGPLAGIITTVLVEMANFSTIVAQQLQDGNLAQSLNDINMWVQEIAAPFAEFINYEIDIRGTVLEAVRLIAEIVYQYSPRALISTAAFGFYFAIWMIFMFVMFADGALFYDYLMEILPVSERHQRHIAGGIQNMLSAVLLGMLATSFVNGTLMMIAFAICSIPDPIMWGIITFGLSFVPIVGATSVWIGGVIYLLMVNAWPWAIGLGLFGVGIIAQVDNVVKPWVMKDRVKVHPVILLLSILGGVKAMGPSGLIFGPVFVGILLSALQIYRWEFVDGQKA